MSAYRRCAVDFNILQWRHVNDTIVSHDGTITLPPEFLGAPMKIIMEKDPVQTPAKKKTREKVYCRSSRHPERVHG